MFCIKCGTQLPDESKFCSNCGTNLSTSNAENINSGKCLFTITRKSSMIGVMIKFKVYIDGSLVTELSSGDSFSMELNNRKHSLYCDAWGYDRTQSYEFDGESNEIEYFAQFPSMIQSMSNFGGRSIIINKGKETRRGTYKG